MYERDVCVCEMCVCERDVCVREICVYERDMCVCEMCVCERDVGSVGCRGCRDSNIPQPTVGSLKFRLKSMGPTM